MKLRRTPKTATSRTSFASIHASRPKRRIYCNIPLPLAECNAAYLVNPENDPSQKLNRRLRSWLPGLKSLKSKAHLQPLRPFALNNIKTSKYTLLSFLPKNLFEQFRRVANLYFLGIVILTFFPLIGNVSPGLSAVPIVTILLITAFKDGYEDLKRHEQDSSLNNSITLTLESYQNSNIDDLSSASRSILTCFRKPKGKGRVRSLDRRPASPSALDPLHPSSPISPPIQSARSGNSSDSDLPTGWISTRWKNVTVGDFILVRNDENIPADIAIVASSETNGQCFVETKNLDGETNLKARQAIKETMHLSTPAQFLTTPFFIDSEPPLTNLYVYSGVLVIPSPALLAAPDAFNTMIANGDYLESHHGPISQSSPAEIHYDIQTVPINIDNTLLRGSTLRNTDWVVGVVVFTGRDTKVMLNSGKTPSKRSRVDILLNPQVILNFIILFCMCLINAIVNAIKTVNWNNQKALFVDPTQNAGVAGVFTFFAAIVIYQNIVPISLYISIEFVKLWQAYFIHLDIELYDPESNERCIPKTWNISDDLGQIEYIFSDKTGTLTQNKMEFRRCSINGIIYGKGYTDVSKTRDTLSDTEREVKIKSIESKMRNQLRNVWTNPYISNAPLAFVDENIGSEIGASSAQADVIKDFFLVLAICHGVLTPKSISLTPASPASSPNASSASTKLPASPPSIPTSPSLSPTAEAESLDAHIPLDYKAQSPDENTLVSTARDLGFVYLSRTQSTMDLSIQGDVVQFEILYTLEFSSTRKRMSVLLRAPDGDIILMCKGADSVIVERLAEGQDEMTDVTLKQLEDFANEGLRTLCVAYRIIPPEEYEAWAKKYHLASTALEKRDERMEDCCELIEQQLILLGSTAIEDKLQDQVPDTIALLREAGIKIWVLTGDKMETAINIGFASNLLVKAMTLIIIHGRDSASVAKQIDKASEKLGQGVHGLVLDGESLRFALENAKLRAEFLLLATRCRSVICCRVSPKQKAQVVRLVKTSLGAMCLSIGDGANDVSMIQEAHVGVGISGQEGLQAAMSSDYVIAQFRFLSRLLLVHGRWSYIRISDMILNFFYKNMVWVFAQFWYQIYAGFSADLLYDYTYVLLFNLIFTVLPVLVMGSFDQDVNAAHCMRYPKLYQMGIKQERFTFFRFWLFTLDGLYQSLVCFFSAYFCFISLINVKGQPLDKTQLGTIVALYVCVTVNVYVGLNIRYWTWICWLVILASVASFICYVPLYAQFSFSAINQIEDKLYIQPYFWLSIIIVLVVNLLPSILCKYVMRNYYPKDVDIVMEIQKYRLDKELSDGEYGNGGKTQGVDNGVDPSNSLGQAKSGKSGDKETKAGAFKGGDMIEMMPLQDPKNSKGDGALGSADGSAKSATSNGATSVSTQKVPSVLPSPCAGSSLLPQGALSLSRKSSVDGGTVGRIPPGIPTKPTQLLAASTSRPKRPLSLNEPVTFASLEGPRGSVPVGSLPSGSGFNRASNRLPSFGNASVISASTANGSLLSASSTNGSTNSGSVRQLRGPIGSISSTTGGLKPGSVSSGPGGVRTGSFSSATGGVTIVPKRGTSVDGRQLTTRVYPEENTPDAFIPEQRHRLGFLSPLSVGQTRILRMDSGVSERNTGYAFSNEDKCEEEDLRLVWQAEETDDAGNIYGSGYWAGGDVDERFRYTEGITDEVDRNQYESEENDSQALSLPYEASIAVSSASSISGIDHFDGPFSQS